MAGRKKKKNKRNGWKKVSQQPSNGSQHKMWRQLYYKATQGEFSEQDRANIAKRAAMMEGMKLFCGNIAKHIDKCNTNLGLMLDSKDIVLSSLFYEVAKGEVEYVPVTMFIHLGEPQTLEEHVNFLTGKYKEELGLEPVEEGNEQICQNQKMTEEYVSTITT